MQFQTILFPVLLRREHMKTKGATFLIPNLLIVLLSIPFNKLPCAEATLKKQRTKIAFKNFMMFAFFMNLFLKPVSKSLRKKNRKT